MHQTTLLPVILLPATALASVAGANKLGAHIRRQDNGNSTLSTTATAITTTTIEISDCPTIGTEPCTASETTIVLTLTPSLSETPLFPLPNSTAISGTGSGTGVGTIGTTSTSTTTKSSSSVTPVVTTSTQVVDAPGATSTGGSGDQNAAAGVRVGMAGVLGVLVAGLVGGLM